MKGKIDLSIILINWNGGKVTLDCINSLVKTIKKTKYEIILVDNGSKDNVVKTVKRIYPNIRIVENSYNNYFAGANNQGYKISKGEYLFILNSDTIALPDSIDNLFSFAKEDKLNVLTCKLLNKDGSVQYLHRSFPSFIKIVSLILSKKIKLFSFLPLTRKYLLLDEDYKKDFELEQAAGTAILISRKLIDKLGYLFDEERFPLLYNDVDLCYRINKIQGKILCHTSVEIYHLKGVSTKKLNFDNYSLHYAVSSLNFFKKHKLWIDYLFMAIFIKSFFLIYYIFSNIVFFLGLSMENKKSLNNKKNKLKQIFSERFNVAS